MRVERSRQEGFDGMKDRFGLYAIQTHGDSQQCTPETYNAMLHQ